MKKIILYIAVSLDGFIAKKNGSVDWLSEFSNHGEDYGYKKFLDSVDTVLLGNTTYKEFKAPYENKKCFVFSRKNSGKIDNVTYVNIGVKDFVKGLHNEKNIWLVGGADIAKEFLKNNLIDEFIVTIIPILLGDGISLFKGGFVGNQLELQNVKSYDSGVVQLHYQFVH